MTAYNYPSFPLDMEASVFAAFRDVLKAGDRAPKGTLIDAAVEDFIEAGRQSWGEGPVREMAEWWLKRRGQ